MFQQAHAVNSARLGRRSGQTQSLFRSHNKLKHKESTNLQNLLSV